MAKAGAFDTISRRSQSSGWPVCSRCAGLGRSSAMLGVMRQAIRDNERPRQPVARKFCQAHRPACPAIRLPWSRAASSTVTVRVSTPGKAARSCSRCARAVSACACRAPSRFEAVLSTTSSDIAERVAQFGLQGRVCNSGKQRQARPGHATTSLAARARAPAATMNRRHLQCGPHKLHGTSGANVISVPLIGPAFPAVRAHAPGRICNCPSIHG